MDIPGFIRHLREGDAAGALNRIREKNILPGVCGRICLAPCEAACVFHDENNSIGIRALERMAADNGRSKAVSKIKKETERNGIKVAVIGGGPSGLSASAELAKKGYDVTIFEAFPKAGGALRYGVPEFRLPARVLDAEISDILSLGITLRTNIVIGQTIAYEDLLKDFQAVFLAIGALSPRFDSIAGEHFVGVFYAQELLMKINLWEAQKYPKATISPLLGENVVVIGSNYAAIDCARAAIRLGKKVSIVYPGLDEEFKVYEADKKDAVDEGVKLETLVNPLEILSDDHKKVKGLRCERLDFVEDSQGRWDIQAVPGSEFTLDADTIILSGSPRVNDRINKYLPGLQWTDEQTIWIDPVTGQTSLDRIYAAGNAVTGAGILVDAMASGKNAAILMDKALRGDHSTENVTVS